MSKIFRGVIKDLDQYTPDSLSNLLGRVCIYLYQTRLDHPDRRVWMEFSDFIKTKFEERACFKNHFNLHDDPLGITDNLVEQFESVKDKFYKYTLRVVHPGWKFMFHFDPADNLFFQLHGRRSVVLVPFDEGLLNREKYEKNPPNRERHILNPGDCLYIPAGVFHYFESVGDEIAVSCSVCGILNRERYEILDRIWKSVYPEQDKVIKSRAETKNI